MDLLEYQGKRLLADAGMPVSPGMVVRSPQEAEQAQEAFEGEVALKAQTPFGGRGLAGAIRFAATPAEAVAATAELLDLSIKGFRVQEVLVESKIDIDREYYCAIVLDRGTGAPAALLSAAGGVDVEDLAATGGDALHTQPIDPLAGLLPYQARRLVYRAGLKAQVSTVAEVISRAYSVFCAYDCTLLEINPLALTKDGEVLVIDVKMQIDDNALFRHPEMLGFEEALGVAEADRLAGEAGLHYVGLSGDIGIMGNGAGLVMAAMDMIVAAGGSPANFLDVGGGARSDQVAQGLAILLSSESVSAVLINIFGGITRCEEVAQGLGMVLEASQGRLPCPVVVRVEGNGSAEAGHMLKDMPVVMARSLQEAARMVAEMSNPSEGGTEA